tara:strand:- start:502 stop:675 length:174 start_codon:yes stop_codon:yes gene_type:complete
MESQLFGGEVVPTIKVIIEIKVIAIKIDLSIIFNDTKLIFGKFMFGDKEKYKIEKNK